MTRLNCGKAILVLASVVAVATVSADNAMAQSGVGSGGGVNAGNSPTSPRTNDGLFNLRALLSYTFP